MGRVYRFGMFNVIRGLSIQWLGMVSLGEGVSCGMMSGMGVRDGDSVF